VFLAPSCVGNNGAATGTVGNLRRDPFAMLPFCGYNMATTSSMAQFLDRFSEETLPKIFYVKLVSQSADGRWLWPGSEKTAVCSSGSLSASQVAATPSTRPLATYRRPRRSTSTDSTSHSRHGELLNVDAAEWRDEIPSIRHHYCNLVITY